MQQIGTRRVPGRPQRAEAALPALSGATWSQVRQSTVIDAPVEDVWRVLRDFNGHDRWHPAIATSAIEGGEPVDMVGAVRRFRLADGGELREQLLSLSDEKRTLSYCLLEAPLPLMGYVATIRLKPVTDGDAHLLGMALGVPSAGASPRGTDGAGARRRLPRRLRGDPQDVRRPADARLRPRASRCPPPMPADAAAGSRAVATCRRRSGRRRRGPSSSSAMAGRKCSNSRR